MEVGGEIILRVFWLTALGRLDHWTGAVSYTGSRKNAGIGRQMWAANPENPLKKRRVHKRYNVVYVRSRELAITPAIINNKRPGVSWPTNNWRERFAVNSRGWCYIAYAARRRLFNRPSARYGDEIDRPAG